MGLNIKNAEVEKLAAELAAMTGETKTEAIRKALLERKEHLTPQRNRMDGVIEWGWPEMSGRMSNQSSRINP